MISRSYSKCIPFTLYVLYDCSALTEVRVQSSLRLFFLGLDCSSCDDFLRRESNLVSILRASERSSSNVLASSLIKFDLRASLSLASSSKGSVTILRAYSTNSL